MNRSLLDLLKRRFLNIFISLCLLPIYWLSYLIPKKKNLIVFGGSRGKHIADNASYLFNYMKQVEKRYHVKVIWLTKDKLLENRYEKIYYIYSLKGFYYLTISKAAVISHHLDDLIPNLLGGKIIFQVWHGVPLKKIGYLADGWNERSEIQNTLIKLVMKIFPYLEYNKCDYVFTTSDNLIEIMKDSFDLPESNIIVTGQPRNDGLVIEKYKRKNKTKNIVWMPTHRGRSKTNIETLLLEYDFNFSEVEKFLERNNAYLLIKPHFTELTSLNKLFSSQNVSRIKLIADADPLETLKDADILITDYSSVYFDYLLLDRPVIFTPFDYEFYKKEIAGFNFSYEEVTPGPKCFDWNHVLREIEEIFEYDNYANIREEVNSKINLYQDDQSSRRVSERIVEILNK
jgi:CDP-glycerol glycerophosphotransferase (TagB/SpsB family)